MSKDDVIKLERKNDALEHERDRMLAKHDAAIEKAQNAGASEEQLDSLTNDRARTAGIYYDLIERNKTSLREVRNQEEARVKLEHTEQTANAAQAERRAKAQALNKWTASGGDPDAFETAWPGLWARQLEEQVIGKPAASRPTVRL